MDSLGDFLPASQDGPGKSRIVFWLLSLSMVAVFIAYNAGKFKSLPCGPGLLPALERNFIHLDITHLLANLGSFWILSRIEVKEGSAQFTGIVLALLALITTGELVFKIGQGKKCAIGFSGVLFGLIAWELVSKSVKLNGQVILAIILAVVGTSVGNPKVSLEGHALGAAAGVVAGLGTRLLASRKQQ